MKLFIFLLVCVVQASFGYSETIIETYNIMKNITNALEEYSLVIEQNLKNLFEEDGKIASETIDKLKREILEEIENDLEESNEEKSLKEFCYKTATENLNIIFVNATIDVRSCQFLIFFYGYSPIDEHLNHTIEMSNKYDELLGSIIKGCEEPSKVSSDNCLNKENLGAELMMKTIIKIMNQAKKLASEVSEELPSKIISCTPEVTSQLRKKSMEVRLEARKCVSLL